MKALKTILGNYLAKPRTKIAIFPSTLGHGLHRHTQHRKYSTA